MSLDSHLTDENAKAVTTPKSTGAAPSGLMVIEEMKKYATISHEIVRLSDKNIPVGLGFRESEDDEWPGIVDQLKAADIVLFATPVWWGGRSSVMQRIRNLFVLPCLVTLLSLWLALVVSLSAHAGTYTVTYSGGNVTVTNSSGNSSAFPYSLNNNTWGVSYPR